MKIIGQILTLLGSNALTATLVMKTMYAKIDAAINEAIENASDWILENLGAYVGNAINNAIGEIPFVGAVGDAVARVIDNNLGVYISNFIREFHGISAQFDTDGRAKVNLLFYIALAVLIIGVAMLIIGCINDMKKVNHV